MKNEISNQLDEFKKLEEVASSHSEDLFQKIAIHNMLIIKKLEVLDDFVSEFINEEQQESVHLIINSILESSVKISNELPGLSE